MDSDPEKTKNEVNSDWLFRLASQKYPGGKFLLPSKALNFRKNQTQ